DPVRAPMSQEADRRAAEVPCELHVLCASDLRAGVDNRVLAEDTLDSRARHANLDLPDPQAAHDRRLGRGRAGREHECREAWPAPSRTCTWCKSRKSCRVRCASTPLRESEKAE